MFLKINARTGRQSSFVRHSHYHSPRQPRAQHRKGVGMRLASLQPSSVQRNKGAQANPREPAHTPLSAATVEYTISRFVSSSMSGSEYILCCSLSVTQLCGAFTILQICIFGRLQCSASEATRVGVLFCIARCSCLSILSEALYYRSVKMHSGSSGGDCGGCGVMG